MRLEELFKDNWSEQSEKDINNVPVFTDETKERIYARIQRKQVFQDNECKSEYNDSVSGVEQYSKPVLRRVLEITASVAVFAIITVGLLSNKGKSFIKGGNNGLTDKIVSTAFNNTTTLVTDNISGGITTQTTTYTNAFTSSTTTINGTTVPASTGQVENKTNAITIIQETPVSTSSTQTRPDNTNTTKVTSDSTSKTTRRKTTTTTSTTTTTTSTATKPVTKDVTIIFSDVKEGEGYDVGAIQYVYDNGIMIGKSGDIFDPKSILTREQFVQTLYNSENKPKVNSNKNSFSDVEAGQWYVDAVIWAKDNDIVSGYDNGEFGVGDPITREQTIQMFYKYAQLIQYKSEKDGIKSGASDGCEMSDWAKEAMDWAVSYKIITTSSSAFKDPKGIVTRAECAQMIKNFLIDRNQ